MEDFRTPTPEVVYLAPVPLPVFSRVLFDETKSERVKHLLSHSRKLYKDLSEKKERLSEIQG